MIDCMEAGEAYERRVWRIALLLTDDDRAAGEILEHVIGVQPDLAKVGETRLGRMIVQASRERSGAGGRALAEFVELDEGALALWEEVRGLGEQAREAWVFRELEGMGAVETARVMDCSRTAVEEVHLAGAVRALAQRFGEEGLAGSTVRLADALDRLDATGALERASATRGRVVMRRRWVSAAMLGVLLTCFGLMVYVLIDLLGWDERTEMGKMRSDEYSNTVPATGSGGAGGDESSKGGGR